MKTYDTRQIIYQDLAKILAEFNDKDLLTKINSGDKIHIGIGGTSFKLVINGKDMFVKLVPLTYLERQENNLYTTKNIFNLPLYYQYGVGSTGFGVWRELVASKICSNWVLEEKCYNFPILYHYRILPDANNLLNFERQNVAEHGSYWESDKNITERYTQILNAKFMVALFLEYIPFKLFDYLFELKATNIGKAEEFTAKIVSELLSTSRFMSEHGMVHFDSHFHNILTDGKDIYFADHGLVSSLSFDLSSEEKSFLLEHKDFDQYFTIVNLLHCLTISNPDIDNWEDILMAIKHKTIEPRRFPDYIMKLITQYGDLAVVIDEFYKKLQKTSKNTKYPKEQLEQLFFRINNELR